MAVPPPKPLKLATSIQASFGDPEDPDYVFEIVSNGDKSTMAVSLSTNAIKLYSPQTGAFLGDCLGHTCTISGISFPDPNSPMLLLSSSADGTIRTWDIRNRKEVASLNHPTPGSEIWNFAVGGISNQVAGGGDSQVFIWDWRTRKLLANLDEIHTEAVTQVQYHPTRRELLFTASVDGLINFIDTQQPLTNEDLVYDTMSVGTSVGKIGFYGRNNQLLWCQTHIETLSVWDLEEKMQAADFKETRMNASFNWNLDSVNYLIDCYSPAGTDDLWLAAGNNNGVVGYFPASFVKSSHPSVPSVGVLGEVGAVLEGGHQGVVRTIWLSQNMDSDQNLFGWTGGEDGRLCSWSQNGATEHGRSWVSKNLIAKKGSSSKMRHSPY
ncbi:WD repeat-containing protein 89 [Marchantia polymorpha subsp. ruderalis]|uniref:Uncharacterized protein n=4 Tax=Marchantia polymorpha TaxID=3197 RepID=A0A176VPF5_MARPO|nr:hypothetical protein AXG93_2423s1260 [Marchantia polymorpha subsp. ruderalis]PTQ28861.1 hypothetical protein MARPO_0153s0027 [Marchantia polymorpha]BBM98587.1 hypothetical protein Mp_1g14620 [Marchantia polymorpha subsp. ruderalis]|eukprot:PTQ28861.1 hypothetical protein MARPO_0153s0027 [Marchantia polymorpha]